MKYIALPSGLIVNLEQIAFISAPGIYGDQKPQQATLHICFSASNVTKIGGGALHVSLQGDDIKAFLDELANQGLETEATKAAVIKKN